MKEVIKINPNGGIITVNVDVQGIVVAGYNISVYEANSNNVVAAFSGTNQYPENDFFALPNSAAQNVGRILFLNCSFVASGAFENHFCTVSLEIYQDKHKIGVASLKEQLTGKVQDSLILIKLTNS
jgi:hypothetical protein